MIIKAKKKDGWIEGYYYEEDGRSYVLKDKIKNRVNGETVCRSLGICDRLGNKVYENDIVATSAYMGRMQRYVVKWSYLDLRFYLLAYDSDAIFKDVQLPIKYSMCIKVVGNIHD